MIGKNTRLFRGSLAAILSIASMTPFMANAESIQTRPTQDYISIEDRDGLVTATIKRIGNTSNGMVAIGEEEISSFDYRGGAFTSRIGFESNDEERCVEDPNYVFPNESAAKSKYSLCLDESTYRAIEMDMKYLIDNQSINTAFYNYSHPVNIRNSNASGGSELRYIHANVLMTAAQDVGEARRLGVTLTESQDSSAIYMKYENSTSIDVLGDGVVMPGAGVLKVYSMNGGTTPENSTLSLIETVDGKAEDFDASTDGAGYGTDGVENLIKYSTIYMDKYSTEDIVIDYGNPITIATKESGDELIPESLTATVTDRFYYKNECTAEGVLYGQNTEISTDVEYRRDRYIINTRTEAENANMSTITSYVGVDANDATVPVESIEQNHEKVYNYGYNTAYSTFTNQLADPIGTKSSAPQNLFSIGSDDPYNGIEWESFQKGGVATLRDETIKDVDYYVLVEKEAGYYKTVVNTFEIVVGQDEQGNDIYGTATEEVQVWVPPVYEQEQRNSCIHNSQVENFCDIFDCDGSEDQIEGTEEEGYYWDVGSWGQCSVACGTGVQKRAVVCMTSDGSQTSASNCNAATKPIIEKGCTGENECGFTWQTGDWTDCSVVCNGGIKTRDVTCQAPSGTTVSNSYCDPSNKPISQDECNTQQCGYSYKISSWSSCKTNNQCSANAFSVAWRDGYWRNYNVKGTVGYSPTNFKCSTGEQCQQGGWWEGSKITYYGYQSRSVRCFRDDDNKEVSIGYCGHTQPFTHKRCVTRAIDTCHYEEEKGGRDR